MGKAIIKIWILYAVLILVKVMIVSFVTSPSIFSDEYFYAKMAQSFFEEGSLSVHGNPTNAYPPLYSTILSIAYSGGDMTTIYMIMKVINVLLSSLIIFPVFFLAKEVLNEKLALWSAVLVGFMPMSFAFSSFIMSENIFYTIVMCAILCMYKALTERKLQWQVLCGVCIGLAILTRVIGVVLIPVYIIASVWVYKKQGWMKKFFQDGIKGACGCLVIIAPWIIRNAIVFGLSLPGILGSYTRELTTVGRTENSWIISFLMWVIIYISMMVMSGGIVFPGMLGIKWKSIKEKNKVFFIIVIVAIGIFIVTAAHHAATARIHGIANWLPGRPIGRYIDTVLPLVIIGGIVGLSSYKKEERRGRIKVGIIGMCAAIIVGLITSFKVFLANNLSLTWIGGLQYGIKGMIGLWGSILVSITILLVFVWCALWYIKKPLDESKWILSLLVIFFLGTSLLASLVIIKNADRWEESEQGSLGMWIGIHTSQEKILVIDKKDCKSADLLEEGVLCNTKGDTTLIGFWVRKKIRVVDGSKTKEGELLVSTQEYPWKKLKETEHFRVYERE